MIFYPSSFILKFYLKYCMYFYNIVTEAMLRPDSNLLYLILIEGAPEANFHFNEKHMDAINCICNED